jgi:hypothetical protein
MCEPLESSLAAAAAAARERPRVAGARAISWSPPRRREADAHRARPREPASRRREVHAQRWLGPRERRDRRRRPAVRPRHRRRHVTWGSCPVPDSSWQCSRRTDGQGSFRLAATGRLARRCHRGRLARSSFLVSPGATWTSPPASRGVAVAPNVIGGPAPVQRLVPSRTVDLRGALRAERLELGAEGKQPDVPLHRLEFGDLASIDREPDATDLLMGPSGSGPRGWRRGRARPARAALRAGTSAGSTPLMPSRFPLPGASRAANAPSRSEQGPPRPCAARRPSSAGPDPDDSGGSGLT